MSRSAGVGADGRAGGSNVASPASVSALTERVRSRAGWSSAAKPVSTATTTSINPRFAAVKIVSESGTGAARRPSRIMKLPGVAKRSGTEPEGPPCQVVPMPR